MDPKLMQGLMHLLDQAMTRSQWQEAFTPAAAAEEAAEEASGGRKPRYLN